MARGAFAWAVVLPIICPKHRGVAMSADASQGSFVNQNKLKAVILADDFTGACDTGLAFASVGLRTVAHIDGAVELDDVDVIVLDTETRNVPRLEAERRVIDRAHLIRAFCGGLVYKKVDSALRGHLATEILATMRAFDRDLCVMAPAFPAAGRVTIGGYHLVHGVPVERTEVGHDAGAPVRGSYLPHLLESEGAYEVHCLRLEDVEQGAAHVQAMIEGVRRTVPLIVVADAASDRDLHTIATACAALSPPPVLCGSAGLGAHVPGAFGMEGDPVTPGPLVGPRLYVIGTNESTTRNQISTLKAHRHAPEWEVHVEGASSALNHPDGGRVIEAIAEQLASGGDAILSLVGLHAGLHKEDATAGIDLLAEMARRVILRERPGTLVLSGGWTATATARSLGATAAVIEGEVSTGVARGRWLGGAFGGLPIVTKGGALGDAHAFARIESTQSPRPSPADLPVLAVTMGDPSGVGPEVIAKALARGEPYGLCRPIVIGDASVLDDAARLVGATFETRTVKSPEDARFEPGSVDVLNPLTLDRGQVVEGAVSAEAGRAAAEWVIAAVDLAMANKVDGIVTAPLNKEAMNLAGFAYPGHTELLADRSGARDVRLMLVAERMSVAHVTCHVAFNEVPGCLTPDRVFETIDLMRNALAALGREDAKIAVVGLNPHAGENGLFGNEDHDLVAPAVVRAQERGWRVEGPLPADATFFKAYDGLFDGVVAMYHDQGHVPMKLVSFDTGVNVTLGLPIVRASVDHGTAFDIAWQGVAKEGNLICAIDVAARLTNQRRGIRTTTT